MTKPYYRGELYYADLGKGIGSEQEGYRPVVIIQNNMGNKYSPTVIAAPVTTNHEAKSRLPTHCYIGAESGLDTSSVILLEQLRTIDKKRLGHFVGRLNRTHLRQLNQALAISIDLKEPKKAQIKISLCKTCAHNFYAAGSFILRRSGRMQTDNLTCCYCGQKKGIEYTLHRKE
jgi:mRNA interferase MazF